MNFKVSQSVQVVNDALEHVGRAGHVVGPGEGETEGMVIVQLDGEADALAFAESDIKAL